MIHNLQTENRKESAGGEAARKGEKETSKINNCHLRDETKRRPFGPELPSVASPVQQSQSLLNYVVAATTTTTPIVHRTAQRPFVKTVTSNEGSSHERRKKNWKREKSAQ